MTDEVDPIAKPTSRRVADPELIAMSEIIATMDALDPDAQTRVSRWLFDRWGYGEDADARYTPV